MRYSSIYVTHGELAQVTRENPTATGPDDRLYITGFTQDGHRASNQRWLSVQHLRERIGRGRAATQMHVNEYVKKPRQPCVSLHVFQNKLFVTFDVTLFAWR